MSVLTNRVELPLNETVLHSGHIEFNNQDRHREPTPLDVSDAWQDCIASSVVGSDPVHPEAFIPYVFSIGRGVSHDLQDRQSICTTLKFPISLLNSLKMRMIDDDLTKSQSTTKSIHLMTHLLGTLPVLPV